MKTVFITGASSGIGLKSAQYFLEKGWNVVATMRKPDECMALQNSENLLKLTLDVLVEQDIQRAAKQSIEKFGQIDVVLNNAGYALVGALESFSRAQMEKQFNTNVIGLMAVSKAFLPHFRENGGGTIVNIASVGGKVTFPLYAAYHGTKWAVEGISESLNFELNPHNIYVKIVEPGPINTDFYDRSMDVDLENTPEAYADYSKSKILKMNKIAAGGAKAIDVAKVIYKAATKPKGKMRYAIGGGAGMLIFLRKILPESWFIALIRKVL